MNTIIEELGYLSGGSQLRSIYQKLQRSGDIVYNAAGVNFKSTWFPVYYVLAKSNTALTNTEITQRVAFTHITVKNIIRELEEEQLLYIVPNPDDKRSKLVMMTKDGKLMLRKLEPIWESFAIALKEVFASGHPDMLPILLRINSNLDKIPLHDRVLEISRGEYIIRNAVPHEFKKIGELMVKVYSQLDGFPSPKEQPNYYSMLKKIGELTENPNTELLVAVSPKGEIGGAVVYFSDMKFYGSGGNATQEKNASGFRLLAVDTLFRGKGIGKLLTLKCIEKARKRQQENMLIHTTKSMQVAWNMYEKLGFKRAVDLDFMQGELPVFGFRLRLQETRT